MFEIKVRHLIRLVTIQSRHEPRKKEKNMFISLFFRVLWCHFDPILCNLTGSGTQDLNLKIDWMMLENEFIG
jgi:hypothetical protein